MTETDRLNPFNVISNKSHFSRLSKGESLFTFIVSLAVFVFFYFVYNKHILTDAHWDTGWIKQVIWHNILQKMPGDCCSSGNLSSPYISWRWHFTPLFSLVSLLSYLWPFTVNSWLISFFALQPALLVFFICLIYFSRKIHLYDRKFLNYLLPVILCFTLGSLRALAFPHFELLYLVFLLAMIYYAARNQKMLFIVFVILILSIKEDSAFYLVILIWFVFFGFIAFKKLLLITTILLTPSIIYLILPSFVDYSDQISSNFTDMTNLQAHYLGKPFLSHITLKFLLLRFSDIVQNNYLIIILQAMLTIFAFRYKEYLILRLMMSTIPFWVVSFLAFSWVKGQMLTYEIIPIWSSVVIAILFLPYYKLKNLISKKIFINLILVILMIGTINTSSKFLIKSALIETPSNRSIRIIDKIINQAKSEGIKLDTNFFVYDPRLVSHDSWLYDLNEFKVGSCFLHLPNSDRKILLEKNNSNLSFETIQYMNSSFFKTCSKLK